VVELDAGQFSLPITTYSTSYFLTPATAAWRLLRDVGDVRIGVSRDAVEGSLACCRRSPTSLGPTRKARTSSLSGFCYAL